MSRQIDIVLTDDFPILSLTLVSEPLRVANRESLGQAYAWRLLSTKGGSVRSSSGFELQTVQIDNQASDAVLLLSSYHPESALTPVLISWLRARGRAGALMGCVDTAALIFAEAGLLSRRPAAAHFEAMPGFTALYPEEMFVDRLFDFHPPRCSSAGGVATFDMTLALIAHFTGTALADRVAQIMTYLPSRHLGAQANLAADRSLGYVNRDLSRAVDIMISSIMNPVPTSAIASKLNMPDWKLSRLFKRYLHATPGAYYLRLRLNRARNLIRNSHHPIGEVASLCGFEIHETFTRAYKREYGLLPSKDRRGPNDR